MKIPRLEGIGRGLRGARALVFAALVALAGPGCGGDESGSAGSTSAASTGPATGDAPSSTSAGEMSPIYGPCDEICSLGPDNTCIKPNDGSGAEFCTMPCTMASECPPAPGGSAAPDCVAAVGEPICLLDCNGGTCPEGMSCKTLLTGEGARSICFNVG